MGFFHVAPPKMGQDDAVTDHHGEPETAECGADSMVGGGKAPGLVCVYFPCVYFYYISTYFINKSTIQKTMKYHDVSFKY